MSDLIYVYSQNCRGINNLQKRRDLFQHIRTKKYNLICLQDVHIESKLESYIRSEWGYTHLYLSAYSNNSRGVMILINNNFQCQVGRVLLDPNGNFVILELNIQGENLTLASIYGPNEDKPTFYTTLKQNILDFNNEKVIICGDWNLVIDPDMDTENYRNINNPRARTIVLNFIEQDNYIDIWRTLYDTKRAFTWRRLNPERKQARLDYFLISEDIFQFVYDSDIVPGYRTDHSGIILKLKLQNIDRGRGYWKFNNSLLKDKKYVQLVKNTIIEVINTYSTKDAYQQNNAYNDNDDDNNNNNINNKDNFTNNNINFTINDQLFLETLLLIIRGETIQFSSRKKKEKIKEEKQLEEDIKVMENNLNLNLKNLNIEEITKIEEKKNRLYEIRKDTIKGVMIRSRSRYEDLGEKPTSYFLNLEKRNFTSKLITKLIEDDGAECTSTAEILNCQQKYYKTLYSEKVDIDTTSIGELIGENPLKLSDVEANHLEGELTYTELATALKGMKNSKSPGNDGYTTEFFKFFWVDLGIYILRSLNYAYRSGSLSVTQKQGIITCLPKANKSPFFLKNWRPISLLNVTYKMASSVLSARLKTVLDKIVHDDQKGFIAGRFIGENIRLIYDILFETKQQNIPGLILSIDFQQAFDSVSWKFIHKTLDYFNFGPSFKKWIHIFQNGSESCILQNGCLSEFFQLQRGCRQGDPISPYIFILCAEVLSKMIRMDNLIHGIIINNKEFKLSQYADDTQLFLDGSEASLKYTLDTLQNFYQMSGLKINVEKTKAVWIGAMCKSNRKMCREYELDWEQQPFKILGVTFTPEVFDIWRYNSIEVLQKVDKILNSWSKRKITLLGRITVLKSLALSKFVHLFLALPNPPNELVKTLNKMFYKFLWNKGPDRISRKKIIKDITKGGLRMVQIDSFIKALKVSWLRRLIIHPNSCTWSTLSNIDITKVFTTGDNYATLSVNDINNPFWIDILQSWRFFCKSVKVESLEHILYSPIWLNSSLNQGHTLFIKQWYDKGIRNVIDLLNENGRFYEFEEFKQVYNIGGTFLDFQFVLRKIPNSWKNEININRARCEAIKYDCQCNIYIKYLIKDKKGSRTLYDVMIGNKESTQPPNKWVNELGNISIEDWQSYNLGLKDIKEIKLRDFQFKINNRILVTKSFLFKINIIDNDKCSYCQQETETLLHLFFDCTKVKQFWNSLTVWLQTHANIQLQFDIRNVIFSKQGAHLLVNYIWVAAKYYIYRTKFSTCNLNMECFILYLKRKFQSEMLIAKINNKYDKFLDKWSALYDYMSK